MSSHPRVTTIAFIVAQNSEMVLMFHLVQLRMHQKGSRRRKLYHKLQNMESLLEERNDEYNEIIFKVKGIGLALDACEDLVEKNQ